MMRRSDSPTTSRRCLSPREAELCDAALDEQAGEEWQVEALLDRVSFDERPDHRSRGPQD
jgi:hypothetical protein